MDNRALPVDDRVDLPRPGSDTPPHVERLMIELWRRATADQKLARMFGMGRMINELAKAEVRRRYPGASSREIDLRLAARTLPREIMIRGFDWDPDLHGK